MNHLSKPPLNYAMKKRRSNNGIDASIALSNPFSDQDLTVDTSLPTIPASPTKAKSPVSPSVPLEEQISNILESLPARIKLKASSTPNAPDVKPKHKRKTSTSSTISTTSDAPRPGIRSRAATPSLSARPTITLAPADEPGLRRGANDPEIKVYHLVSGNEKPLKLFVRRVGENGERVMVRVGGGWADLAEYLKTYAEHHGHRTVSDGKVEVLGLGNDRVVTPTPGSSGRNSSLGFRSDSRMEGGGRSESRLGTRTDSRQGMRSSEPKQSSLITPIGYPSISGGSGDLANPSSGTPLTTVDTPGEENPTPTSATTPANGSQRKGSSFWEEGGLMGPAAARKGSEMSNDKKEWVDSVVDKAKQVGRKVEFGDLGKKGGTRRVFLKGRSASGTTAAAGEKE
jgi:Tfp pilus assembly protein PilX